MEIAINRCIIKIVKPHIKPFLIILAIYFIAMLSIWRNGVSFADDLVRSIYGTAWGRLDYNRYSSSWISYILNINFNLTDISPLPQMVGMAFLSIAGIMVTYLFCGRKIKYLPLLLSAFIGLSPFTIECWLYKFDPPGFGLCFLASISPMMFWYYLQEHKGRKPQVIFLIITTLCLLVMWTSYQAGNGIYIVMTLGLAFRDFLEKKKISVIFKTMLLFAVPYLLAALIFRFALPVTTGYRKIEVLAFSDMLPGILQNVVSYMKYLYTSLNTEWIVLISFMFICFAVSLFINSKREKAKRLIDVAVGIVFVVASMPISHGALLFLQRHAINARSSLGIGLIFSIVGIITCRPLMETAKTLVENDENAAKSYLLKYIYTLKTSNVFGYILTLSSVAMLYSCIVFSLSLGNALYDQQRWDNFRTEILLADLSRLYSYYNSSEVVEFQIKGDIGLSAVASHVSKEYPIAGGILRHRSFKFYEFRRHYGWITDISWRDFGEEFDLSSWEVILNSYYHTIRDGGDGKVYVELKQE